MISLRIVRWSGGFDIVIRGISGCHVARITLGNVLFGSLNCWYNVVWFLASCILDQYISL